MKKELQMSDAKGLTFEKVWLMMQKTDERFEKRLQKDREDREKERLEREKEREIQWKKAETETKKLKEMIFGLGNNLGQIAEDYFYNSVASDKIVGGIQYNRILRNFKIESKKLNGEYDIVLINSTRLLVIEVKQKPHIKDIEKLIEKQLPFFKKLFPEYAHFKIHGAIAGMTFEENVLDYAKENGLYILTQNQNSKNMQMLNDEDFEAKEF